ncbi:MAG: pyridoxamine 5'-phosphate oxidase family protein [Anaerolineales bacterium]
MTHFKRTDLNRIRRVPDRGAYDRETVYRILDDALICHVGIVQDGRPVVIPMIHARAGDTLLLHGATSSRLQRILQSGAPVCVTVAHLDGIVLARSIYHHSLNYRSAVIFGTGTLVAEEREKWAAMERFAEKLAPGRWNDARQPSSAEYKATAIVSVAIESASAKIRTGPPGDEEDDYALPVWAGVLPIAQQLGPLQPDPRLDAAVAVPQYLRDYTARRTANSETTG